MDYACDYDFITKCRFFSGQQQQDCRGYSKMAGAKHCGWWRSLGDGCYHCTNPEAQAAAVDEFKRTHMKCDE